MAQLRVIIPDEAQQNIEGVVTINAPLEKVFTAYKEIELLKQWWGRGNPVDVKAYEFKNGGHWHFAEQAPDGNSYEFTGSFHEVVDNKRIVQTFEFLGMPERGHVALERADFVKIDEGTTEIRTVSTMQSLGDRDGMLQSGMEDGWRASVEALGKLVEEK